MEGSREKRDEQACKSRPLTGEPIFQERPEPAQNSETDQELNTENTSGYDTSANSRIKILYSNVRSIVNKIEELKHTSF